MACTWSPKLRMDRVRFLKLVQFITKFCEQLSQKIIICDKFGNLIRTSYVCSPMNKLLVHKNLSPKALFRATRQVIYNKPGWDIARTKEELVAYLTQFQPDVISIGDLKQMTSLQVAQSIHAIYVAAGIKKYPRILIDKQDVNHKQIKLLFG